MPLQQVAKAKDRGLVGHARGAFQPGEAAIQRELVQSFFDSRIAEVPPNLQAMGAQHGLDGNGGRPPSASCALRVWGRIKATSTDQGTTWFISSRKTSLRVFLGRGSRPSQNWLVPILTDAWLLRQQYREGFCRPSLRDTRLPELEVATRRNFGAGMARADMALYKLASGASTPDAERGIAFQHFPTHLREAHVNRPGFCRSCLI